MIVFNTSLDVRMISVQSWSSLEFSVVVSSEVGGVSLGLSWCTVMVQCTLYSDGTLYSDDTPCTTAMRLAPLCRQSVRVL